MGDRIKELYRKADALPEQPGVYIMKNSSDAVIYIGKAKNLRNRVSQYFGAGTNHTVKVRKMVDHVDHFDYIIVANEFEALALECSLIKQNKPKYNILLKDDKGFYYIRVDDSGWKKISAVKQKLKDQAVYHGPYMASDYVASAVREAQDIFMLPHCGKNFPKDINRNARPCLNYYIKLCSGACCGKITEREHNENAEAALKFVLSGRNEMLKTYRREMEEASERLDFEKAAKLRDKIRAIEKIGQRQIVVSKKYRDQDVIGVESLRDKSCICLLKFREGSLTDTDTLILDRIEKNAEEYTDLIVNYYAGKPDVPERICIDIPAQGFEEVEEFLFSQTGKKTGIYEPKTGENLALIEMAHKNAQEKLARILAFDDKKKAALHELQELLGLENFPEYIESYDISNMAGSENVGGMIVYRNGRPLKKNYRRFMIKSFEGQDDFRSLAEVLTRRISEYKLDPDSGEGFGIKPDLILLDGGAGQVSAVRSVLEERGFDVPLFGMVKDGKHRTRAITGDGGEITINDNRTVFSLVSEIQEEVHRYAISYHHKLKEKNTLASSLKMIDGVGDKRARNLLIKFKTIANIRAAGIEELMTVPGINRQTAENIDAFFRNTAEYFDE